MKKNYYLLFSCGMISMLSLAQPTLTATGVNPVIGDAYNTMIASYVSPGNAGTNQSYDISSAANPTVNNQNFVSPSSGLGSASFPNANLCAATVGAANYAYYKSSSTAFQMHGVYGSGVTIAYNNPEDMLHYPFTMNNTFTDTWGSTFVSNGTTFVRKGVTVVTADGYGTLKTPVGTYSNVLRVKFEQTYSDSTYIAGFGEYIINYTNEEYFWYSNNNHFPIAFVYTLTNDISGSQSQSGYITTPTGINQNELSFGDVKLYPNPANDIALVSFTSNVNSDCIVKILNIAGSEIYSFTADQVNAFANTIQLKTSELSDGVYFVQLQSGNTTSTPQKLIIAH